MRVTVHPADMGGCGMYRLVWPAEALAAQGHDVKVWEPTDAGSYYPMVYLDTFQGKVVVGLVGDVGSYKSLLAEMAAELALARKRGASNIEQQMLHSRYMTKARELSRDTGRDAVDADVIVIQRPMTRPQVELIDAMQAAGVAVVVEVDDDFHAIHPRNPAWKGANPLTDPDAHRDWLMRACERADLVTVSTPALAARYGAHGRVVVLDNYVPERYCTIERAEHDPVRVGWSGAVETHPGDLDETGGGVAAAIRAHGAMLRVVGTGKGVGPALGYDGPVNAAGWVPIVDYPAELACLDVGIVPLKLSPFNEAKSHLKGLELAACGVPFVASPTGPYRRLADLGIGWLADTPTDWRYLIGEMIQDDEHRQALSEAWRAEVAARWTVEANAWRWAEAWEQALAFSRERVAA